MFAKVELTDEIIKFIKEAETYNESFEEIKELIFTSDMLKREYSFYDQINIILQFQKIKNNTFYKTLNNKELNYIEGMLLERLITKYNGLKIMPFEQHLKLIENCCEYMPEKKKFFKIFDFILERIRQIWIRKKQF